MANRNNKDYLERLIIGRYRFAGVPDTVDMGYVWRALIDTGRITWFRADDGTIRALRGALSGVGVYNEPTDYVSVCPVEQYSGQARKVGVDCVVQYTTDNHYSPRPMATIIRHYADLLNEVDTSINAALINSRVATIYHARDDIEAQKIRLLCDDIAEGKPFVITNSGMLYELSGVTREPTAEHIPVRQNYVVDMLIRDRQAIISQFLSEVGINNTPYEKKERMVTDEVGINDEQIKVARTVFDDSVISAINAVNSMFDLNITVNMVYSDITEGSDDNV